MYTPMIQHRTPNVIEGVPLSGIGAVSDYIPAGITGAWEDIKAQVSGIGSSTWFGYAAIGLGALMLYGAFSSLGGRKRRR
jgi:hypothetical protein